MVVLYLRMVICKRSTYQFQFASLALTVIQHYMIRLLWRQKKSFSGDSAQVLIYLIQKANTRMRAITSLIWSSFSGPGSQIPHKADLCIWFQSVSHLRERIEKQARKVSALKDIVSNVPVSRIYNEQNPKIGFFFFNEVEI